MFRNCVRVVLVGLVAATCASAQRTNDTDLSGHSIEYDLFAKSALTQIEVLEPIVKAFAKPNVTSLYTAWVNKFQKAANSGTMSRQQNIDDLNAFRTSAYKQDASFAADAKAALAKSAMDYFKFHAFMPAATYDIVEYGILHLENFKFNYSSINPIKAYMTKNIDTAKVVDLQSKLNTYMAASEKSYPGFKAAVIKKLNAVYKTAQANNPTVAPTPTPSVATSPTKTPNSASSATAKDPATTTAVPTVEPDLVASDPLPEAESTTTGTTVDPVVPTPAPTTKSGALVVAANVVVSTAVFVVASAFL